MSDTQTDKPSSQPATPAAILGQPFAARDAEHRDPPTGAFAPSDAKRSCGERSRAKSISNRACHQRRKAVDKGMHIWLPTESARMLDACRNWVADGRGRAFSRGSLIAILADELTEQRLSQLARLHPDKDRGLVLSAFLSKALDRLISEASAKAGLDREAGEESWQADAASAPNPAGVAKEAQPATAEIMTEFEALMAGNLAAPSDRSDRGNEVRT